MSGRPLPYPYTTGSRDNAVPLQVLLQQQLAVQGTPHRLPDLCTHFLQDSGLVQVRRRLEEGRSTPLTTSPVSHEHVQL